MDELTKQYDAATAAPATPAAGTTGTTAGNSLTGSYNASAQTPMQTPAQTPAQEGATTAPAATATPAAAQPTPFNVGANSTADRVNAINTMYDAQQQARLNELQNAYDLSRSDMQAAADQINPNFQRQANDLAVQYERNRRNFNEGAILNGINTGAGAQADLARASEYQRDFGNLRTAQANQMAEAERQMANLTASYQTNIQTALANNDYQRAAALLDEYNNGYERDLKNAQILAEFGDFSGYAGLYGREQADNMFAIWASQNPDLAYLSGNITKDQLDNLKGKRPMNEGLDENGNRIPATGGGGGNYGGDPWGYGGSYYNWSGGGTGSGGGEQPAAAPAAPATGGGLAGSIAAGATNLATATRNMFR